MPHSLATEATDDDREEVENERRELRDFIKSLDKDDLTSGNWFTKLLTHALEAYTKDVDWKYFQDRYEGVPADAIVDQRIKMAARYAAIEGGLSASAYSGAALAALAAPVVVGAAAVTVAVDIAYTARLQIRLAYDIAVLYRVPIDVDDPDDLWKLIRVAFTIKGAQVGGDAVIKAVPAIVRPLVKAFYKGSTITAAKSVPVIGKFLLQRNVIKIGIPVVGVPLGVLMNFYSTVLAGKHARGVFRNEARVVEVATKMTKRTEHPHSMLWVAWMLVMADGKITDDEALLMQQLTRLAKEGYDLTDEELASVIDLDANDVWQRLDAESGDLSDLLDVALRTASIDGDVNKLERAVLDELASRYEEPDR